MKNSLSKYIGIVLGVVVALFAMQTSAYYEYGKTEITECPIPDEVLADPTKTLDDLISWDRYNPNGDYNGYTCYARDVSECPYGIARWVGQCTYYENTSAQYVDDNCVDRVRAHKTLMLLDKGICVVPGTEGGTGGIDIWSGGIEEIVVIPPEPEIAKNYYILDPQNSCGAAEDEGTSVSMHKAPVLIAARSSLWAYGQGDNNTNIYSPSMTSIDLRDSNVAAMTQVDTDSYGGMCTEDTSTGEVQNKGTNTTTNEGDGYMTPVSQKLEESHNLFTWKAELPGEYTSLKYIPEVVEEKIVQNFVTSEAIEQTELDPEMHACMPPDTDALSLNYAPSYTTTFTLEPPYIVGDDYVTTYPEWFAQQNGITRATAQGINEAMEGVTSNQAEVDPVALFNGELVYHDTFLQLPAAGMPYTFELSYRNQIIYNGFVGYNFDHNRNVFVREEDGEIYYFDGKLHVYKFVSEGDMRQNKDIQAEIEEDGEGYKLTFANGLIQYFETQSEDIENLRIVRHEIAPGLEFSFDYDEDAKLISVTDSNGRLITYTYNDDDRLEQVSDPYGRTVYLSYYEEGDEEGSEGDLKEVEVFYGTDSKRSQFTYTKMYKEGDGDEITDHILSHNIQTLVDAKHQTYVFNVYDVDDRVIYQKYGEDAASWAYRMDENDTVRHTLSLNRKGQPVGYEFDTEGRMTAVHVPDEAVDLGYEYDGQGNLIKETLPNGTVASYSYDDQGNLTQAHYAGEGESQSKNYTYNSQGLVTSMTNSQGIKVTNSYNAEGLLTQQTTQPIDGSEAARTVNYSYNSHKLIATMTLPDGQVISYSYDAYDQITSITQTSNEGDESITMTLTRDAYGNVTSITDGEGNTRTMGYTSFDQLQSLTTPEGIQKFFAYDVTNNMTSAVTVLEDGSYVNQSMNYDILDNLTNMTFDITADSEGTVSIAYDPNENISNTTNPEGTRRTYQYDAFQRLVKRYARITTTDGIQQVIAYNYEYDKVGNLIKTTDPLGHETNFEYNRLGQITKATNAEGTYAEMTYDEKKWLTQSAVYSTTGQLLQKTTYDYDARGQIIQVSQHDVVDTSRVLSRYITYDAYGRTEMTKDHRGGEVSYTYDGFGRLESITDPLGKTTLYMYNNNHQVIAEIFVTAEGKTLSTLYDYDQDGRLISTQNHVGYTQELQYNNLNQLVGFTDAESNGTTYRYDYRGNLLAMQENDGRVDIVTEHRYDKNGNLISLTDGEGNTSTFLYDDLDRQIQRILPDGSTTTYRYDENSNLIKRTDPNGNIVVNTYDVMDRLITRDITLGINIGGVTAEVYRYDPLGRLVYSNDSQQNEQIYVYDGLGGLISETNGGKEVTYSFDEVHDLSQIIYPSGRKFGRSYDILGRLTEVQDQWNWSNVASYSYDSASLLNTSYGNFTETNYSYDQLLRLRTMSHDKFTTPSPMNSIDYRYTYDKVNNIVKNGQDTYRYDDIYRLTNVRYNDGDLVKRQNGELEKGSHESTDYNQWLQNRNYDKVGNRRTEYNDVPFVPIKNDIHIYSNCHPGGNGGHTNTIEQQYSKDTYQESCPLTEQDAIVGGTKGGKGKASTKPNDAYDQYQESGTTTSDTVQLQSVISSEALAESRDPSYASDEIILQDIDTEMSRRDAITARPSSEDDNTMALTSSTLVAAKGGGGGSKGGTNIKNNGNANYKGNGADKGFKKGRNKTKKTEAKATRCARKAATDKDADGGWTKKCENIEQVRTDISVPTPYPELFTGEEPEILQDFVVYHPNELNQYMSVTYGNLSGIKLDYDANGNLVQNEKFRFQYDYKNRLIKARTYSTVGAGPFVYTAEDPERQAAAAQEYLVVEFTYDTMGRRVTKRVDRKSNVGRFIKYIYAGQDAIEEERFYNIGEGREQLKEYVYGAGIDDVIKVYIESTDGGRKRQQRFYKDHQGSVVAIADDKGKIVESYRYDAFGNLILGFQKNDIKFNLDPSDKNAQKNVADSKMWITNNRLYTAREWDEELELYYYRGRHYDARMGRFMQRDPIGYVDDVNLYTYVGNNPVNYVDPWGLEKEMWRKRLDFVFGKLEKTDWSFMSESMSVEAERFSKLAADFCLMGYEEIGSMPHRRCEDVMGGLDYILMDEEQTQDAIAARYVVAETIMMVYGAGGPRGGSTTTKPPTIGPKVKGGANISNNVNIRPKARVSSSSPYQVRINPKTNKGPMAINTSKFKGGVRTLNGGIRESRQFWKARSKEYSNTLSEANRGLIKQGKSPVVDDVRVKNFPEHANYIGETIIHHHLDQGIMAIPLPESVHGNTPGFGIWHGDH